MNPGQMPNRLPNRAPAPVSDQVPVKSCFNCGFHGPTADVRCPQCRKPKIFTEQNIRMRGVAGIFVGLFMVIFIGAIAVGVGLLIYGAAKTNPRSARDINSSAGGFLAMYLIFGAIALFGIHTMII